MIHVEDYNLEPPEDIISCYCYECGREILVGEDYYHFEDNIICEDCISHFKRIADEPV